MGDTLLTGESGGDIEPGSEAALAAFQESIPEEFRAEPSMAVIKDMSGLVKSYVAGQKIIGVPTERLVTIPNAETAEQSDWDAYYNKLGRPEKGADYKLQTPKDMPEGIALHETTIENVSNLFHKYGLTPKQASGIFDEYNAITLAQLGDQLKASDLASSNEMTDLKKEWGAAWDAKLDTATRAMVAFGDDTFRKWLDVTKLGDNPMMLKIFSSIGEKLMESSTDLGDGGKGFRTLAPDEAKAEIAALQADENFTKAYTTQNHPGHKDAVDKMTRLFGFANPPEAA